MMSNLLILVKMMMKFKALMLRKLMKMGKMII